MNLTETLMMLGKLNLPTEGGAQRHTAMVHEFRDFEMIRFRFKTLDSIGAEENGPSCQEVFLS